MTSLYSKQVLKKLKKLLEWEKKYQNETFKLNHGLLSAIREKSVKLREKPLSRSLKIEMDSSNLHFILTFRSGQYPNYSKPICKDARDYFPVQISFNVKTTSFLCEAMCLSNDSDIIYSLVTSHPIQIPRSNLFRSGCTAYRGRLLSMSAKETKTSLFELLKEKGVTQETINLCVDIARDKEERLKAEWFEKVLDFLNAS